MPDLRDGESVEMQGSAAQPYVLKNVGGVFSCSCPAWRHQSLSIDRRSCKHLCKLRGSAVEEARVGTPLPSAAVETTNAQAPALLLAQTWDGAEDPTGWLLSEKLDGVRAYFDGRQLWSRLGNRFHAPDWFLAGLPDVPLDGELWLGRKQFQRTVGIVRRQDQTDLWKEVRYLVFDAPALDRSFEQRLDFIRTCMKPGTAPYAQAHEHQACRGADHLRAELTRVEARGGEGLMLRRSGSRYESGRSATLQKIKSFHDAEARVLRHVQGAGRHRGRLGALLVELPDGTTFSVGTGFSDKQREHPPPVGSRITFRYQELTDRGVPRFPSFVGDCLDSPLSRLTPKGEDRMSSPVNTATRRFEFVEGSSSKFWTISIVDMEVQVQFGRIGSQGQRSVKRFADAAGAEKHAENLVRQKLAKGYSEVR
jgi:DNA ligase-1